MPVGAAAAAAAHCLGLLADASARPRGCERSAQRGGGAGRRRCCRIVAVGRVLVLVVVARRRQAVVGRVRRAVAEASLRRGGCRALVCRKLLRRQSRRAHRRVSPHTFGPATVQNARRRCSAHGASAPESRERAARLLFAVGLPLQLRRGGSGRQGRTNARRRPRTSAARRSQRVLPRARAREYTSESTADAGPNARELKRWRPRACRCFCCAERAADRLAVCARAVGGAATGAVCVGKVRDRNCAPQALRVPVRRCSVAVRVL